jgi:hypothetical protein
MYSAPVIRGERLFIGDRAGSIHCLDPATGSELWTSSVADGDLNSTFSTLKTPAGSLPCDIDYLGRHAVIGAPRRSRQEPGGARSTSTRTTGSSPRCFRRTTSAS